MERNDLESWKVCWQVNLLFYKPVFQAQRCLLCSKIQLPMQQTRRSVFWLEATCCSEGHRQATIEELEKTLAPSICATCDQNYVLEIVKGKYICRIEGCRRTVRVDKAMLEEKLRLYKTLAESFFSLLQRFKSYECTIHGDDVEDESDLISAFRPPITKCDHDRRVCDKCLTEIFERAIRGGRLQDLVCPDPECKQAIELDTARQLLSAESFKMYNRKLAIEKLSREDRFRWCCCGHGQIHEPGEISPEWYCLQCKKRHCYICREENSRACEHLHDIDSRKSRRKHRQRDAAQFILSNKSDQATREEREQDAAATHEEIARTTKKCPGCGNKIERKGGCGHFTCRKCQTDFCWCCKVIWKGGKALHLSTCEIGTVSRISKEDLDTEDYATGWDDDRGYDLTLDKDLWLIDSQQ